LFWNFISQKNVSLGRFGAGISVLPDWNDDRMRIECWVPKLALLAMAATVGGCVSTPSVSTTFDRTLTVTGPVRLELRTGSGDARVRTGEAGAVRIHGEVSARSWFWGNPSERVEQLRQNPPIEQESNMIRIGEGRTGSVEVKWEIEVPSDTEMRAITGSGDVEVNGIKGPLNVSSGSGDITAQQINEETTIHTSSGDIVLSAIGAAVQLTTGSGDLTLNDVHGEIRAHTGSGDIQVSQPGGDVTVDTGSGDVTISKMAADLRVRTSSGDVTIDGQPAEANFWEAHTGSGDVELRLGANPSFRLDARSSSGDIQTSVPLVIEGTESKHELRAKAGDGRARIDVQTSSGGITLE
jgi:hypothetical protein